MAKKNKKEQNKENLTPKMELFCKNMVAVENGTKAAIASKYSENGAEQRAYKLLKLPKIQTRLDQLRKARDRRIQKNQDGLLLDIWRVLEDDYKNYYNFIEEEKKIFDVETNEYTTKTTIVPVLKDLSKVDTKNIKKISFDKFGNTIIELECKTTNRRLLADIYYKLKENDSNKDINVNFNGKTLSQIVKEKEKKVVKK
jgi:phage terminase small subunit